MASATTSTIPGRRRRTLRYLQLADTTSDSNNFGAAPRHRVLTPGQRQPLGHSREHGHHVRPDAARRLRDRIQANGLPERTQRERRADRGRRAGLPEHARRSACRASRRRRQLDPVSIPTSRWRAPGRTTSSTSARSASSTTSRSVATPHVQGDLLPVIMNINPINPIGQLADGRPIFSAPSSRDASGSALQPDQRRAVGSAIRPTTRWCCSSAVVSAAACSSTSTTRSARARTTRR